jgi:hypothetical protein
LENESRQRRSELKKADRRARIQLLQSKILAAGKPGAVWLAIALVVGVLVHFTGGAFLVAGGAGAGVFIFGLILLRAYRKN